MDTPSPPNRQTIYVRALAALPGIGPRSVLHLLQAYPAPELFTTALGAPAHSALSPRLRRMVGSLTISDWDTTWCNAERRLQRNLDAGIAPISISDSRYPALLRSISDPPPILYVRGRVPQSADLMVVAIVGTREPTDSGVHLATQLAQGLTKAGFVIVSGLARGIDTAAHRGTLSHGGWTVAVMGTSLDTIYPPENQALAASILEQRGTWISEYGVGEATGKASFLLRDRIQSGLSIGVIPVQTNTDGGTMHTVRYAEQQKRLLLCPIPPDVEQSAPQWAGVQELIRTKRAMPFNRNDLPTVVKRLREWRAGHTSIARTESTSPKSRSPKQLNLFPST